jgi:hypothetical protein
MCPWILVMRQNVSWLLELFSWYTNFSASSSSNGSSSRWSFLPAIGEDNAFGLSRVQRIVGFFVCLAMALFCFGFVRCCQTLLFDKWKIWFSLAGYSVHSGVGVQNTQIRPVEHIWLCISDVQVN